MDQASAASSSSSGQSSFKVGDRVRVDLEVEVLKVMQEGHGGWNPKMAEVRWPA